MITTLTKIPSKLETLLPVASKMAGTFDTQDCICVIEESLTSYELEVAEAFLTWLNESGKTFGHNIKSVFIEFLESKKSS